MDSVFVCMHNTPMTTLHVHPCTASLHHSSRKVPEAAATSREAPLPARPVRQGGSDARTSGPDYDLWTVDRKCYTRRGSGMCSRRICPTSSQQPRM